MKDTQTIVNHESDILAAMVNAFRANGGLSNQQLRIKVRDDLYRNAPAGAVDYLDSLDAVALNRLGAKAFDLRLRPETSKRRALQRYACLS